MSINNSKTDTHIYNIINNPPKEFTEPCECCGVSEFQLGVKHAEERIIKLLEKHLIENDEGGTGYCQGCDWFNPYAVGFEDHLIALIKGENK